MRLEAVIKRLGRVKFFKDSPHDDAEIPPRLDTHHEPFEEIHFLPHKKQSHCIYEKPGQ